MSAIDMLVIITEKYANNEFSKLICSTAFKKNYGN